MKQLLPFLTAGMILLSGCSSIIEPETVTTSTETAFVISATLDELDVDEATKATASTVVRLNWNAGDRISAVNLTTGKALGGDLVAQRAGSTTEFSGTLTGSISIGDQLGFIYPAQGYAQEQAFTGADIDLYEQNGKVDEDKFVVTSTAKYTGTTNSLSLTFKFLVSYQFLNMSNLPANATVNELCLTGVSNTVSIGADFATKQSAADRITVKPSGLSTNAKGGRSAFVKVPVCQSNDSRKVKVSTSKGDFVASFTSDAIPVSKFTNRIISDFTEFTYIEDPIFETYLMSNFDLNHDGILSQAECDAVTEINCAGYEELDEKGNWVADHFNGITSLKGIEKFKNIITLNCGYNRLTSLDVSQNTKLENISCANNQINALDLSNCTALINLTCWRNNLSTLDLSNNSNLQNLDCWMSNLTSLDVSNNLALKDLRCAQNDFSANGLDLSKNLALEYLYCNHDNLSSLDVSANTKLIELGCYSNQLNSLDVSHNPALRLLNCNNNKLTSLDINVNTTLNELCCDDNQLKTIDVTKNTELNVLHCSRNQLTEIDLLKNVALRHFDCFDNDLASLDVSKNLIIESLNLGGNPRLTTLELSNNPELRLLNCSGNNMTTLDISKNKNLNWLLASGNKFTSLNLIYGDFNNNTEQEYPVECASEYLKDVYLLRGWDINGLTYNRSEYCINAKTTIHFVENTTDIELGGGGD